MTVWRDYNLQGGRCAATGCDRWGRFKYLLADEAPSYDRWVHVLEGYCCQKCWRSAQPRRQYVPTWPHPGKGELHPRAKLKDMHVVDIKQRLQDGESYSAIARSYGVSRQTIAYIRKGSTWKQIPWPTPSKENAA